MTKIHLMRGRLFVVCNSDDGGDRLTRFAILSTGGGDPFLVQLPNHGTYFPSEQGQRLLMFACSEDVLRLFPGPWAAGEYEELVQG